MRQPQDTIRRLGLETLAIHRESDHALGNGALEHVPPGPYTLCVSILADKDADAMLGGLARAGDRFVATRSSNARALPAQDLAALARLHFGHVEAVEDVGQALARAHALGEPVLVTGSLYLLSDLETLEREHEGAAWAR